VIELRNLFLAFLFAAAVQAALTATSAIAGAQAQTPPAPAALPSDTELDTLVDARDWNALGAAFDKSLDAESFDRGLTWLHNRSLDGGGLMLSIIYAHDLWMAGGQLKTRDPDKDMRLTAGMMALYTYEQIVIDGAKCEDQTAPGQRLTQILTTTQKAALNFLRQQPKDVKMKVVDLALAVEKKTAPLRKDDDLICRGGMDEMMAGLEQGTQHELPPDGDVGKKIGVEAPADWTPKFRSPETYRPIQESARANMRAQLLKLVDAAPAKRK
jgi:hypothetical protein